jgi:hypothetical protein
MKYKKHPAYLGMVLLTLVACGAKNPQTAKPDARSIERRLAQIAGQANQAAPADIDPNTRLDGAKAGPGLRLTTTYTLINPEAEGISSSTFDTKLTPVVKEGSCKNPELRPLIDLGVVVVLEYRGTDGNPIGTVNINRDSCAAPK